MPESVRETFSRLLDPLRALRDRSVGRLPIRCEATVTTGPASPSNHFCSQVQGSWIPNSQMKWPACVRKDLGGRRRFDVAGAVVSRAVRVLPWLFFPENGRNGDRPRPAVLPRTSDQGLT